MRNKWRVGAAALGLGLIVGPIQASSAETITTPAPPGVSEAVALNVLDIVAVGHTKAGADSTKGEATANAVEIGGTAVFGGTQKGKGKTSGDLLDTGETPLGRLAVAPWEASVDQTATKRTADSDAALLRLILIDSGTLSVDVLRTRSHAEHTDEVSKGRTVSDGVDVNLGDGGLHVIILHSETSNEAKGTRSYVVGINGNYILDDEDSAGRCAINIPSLVALGCLNAKGGIGSSIANVAEGTVIGRRAAVVSGASTFGVAPAAVLPEDLTREPPAGPAGPGLARTGAAFLGDALVIAFTMLLLGSVVLVVARERKRQLAH